MTDRLRIFPAWVSGLAFGAALNQAVLGHAGPALSAACVAFLMLSVAYLAPLERRA